MTMSASSAPGALLLCLDLQAPFVSAIVDGKQVTRRCEFALRAAQALGIPIALTEQVPAKLGPTIEPILAAAGDEVSVFAKNTFSALACDELSGFIAEQEIEHLLICGIETPICVYQTALDAINQDLVVTVLTDAIGARRPADAASTREALARHGAHLLPSESVFYALLHDTDHAAFKSITQLVKSHA